jgi:hypothetical protein
VCVDRVDRVPPGRLVRLLLLLLLLLLITSSSTSNSNSSFAVRRYVSQGNYAP